MDKNKLWSSTFAKTDIPKVEFEFTKSLRNLDYESPITIIAKEAATQFENDVLSAVQEYEISVDKEELIKALSYDRGQYDRGFEAGMVEGLQYAYKMISGTRLMGGRSVGKTLLSEACEIWLNELNNKIKEVYHVR